MRLLSVASSAFKGSLKGRAADVGIRIGSVALSEFLTTKEVADLLRIKERKVYELVAEKAIPASRVTGKLLFPKDLIDAWVRSKVEFQDEVESLANRPLVMAGSHDPLLDWAIRASECEIATLFEGSLAGLKRLGQGRAIAAGLHVFEPETGDWNRMHVDRHLHGRPLVLIEWCVRTQGLVVAQGNPRSIRSIADLEGVRFAPRQKDAGSRHLFDHLLQEAGIKSQQLDAVSPPARNEADVATMIADGKADAGLAIESVARQYRLDFVPLFSERFDLAVWRKDFFEAPMQTLLRFAGGEAFAARARELDGYDISGFGTIHFNGP